MLLVVQFVVVIAALDVAAIDLLAQRALLAVLQERDQAGLVQREDPFARRGRVPCAVSAAAVMTASGSPARSALSSMTSSKRLFSLSTFSPKRTDNTESLELISFSFCFLSGGRLAPPRTKSL